MIKMSTPRLAKYLVGDLLEYAYNVVNVCGERRPPMPPAPGSTTIDPQIEGVQKAAEALNQNYKVALGSPLSDELTIVDMERDRLLIGLHTTLEGLSYHFNASTAGAAALLLTAMDKYDTRIHHLHYEIETTTINSLLNDFTTDANLTAALTLLNLMPWVAQMRTSNDRFRQLYISRAGDKTDTKRTPTVELRQNLHQALNNLFAHLTAHATLSNDATIPLVISDINNLTARYNQLVNSRLSRPQETTEQPSADSYTGV